MTEQLSLELLLQQRPHLFSSFSVSLSQQQFMFMQEVVRAVEAVVALPAYRERVLTWAPEIAQYDPGIPGLFLGYDFHITPDGAKLIEINTNAGGAALTKNLYGKNNAEQLCAIFISEWQLQRGEQPLKRIAIIDEEPEKQYLLPEFMVFQAWFKERGIDAIVVDPKQLTWKNKIFYQDQPLDLIYNRLTDFSLALPQHEILRSAYLANAVVLTPHPRAHALYADKRNFCVLGDADLLSQWGVSRAIITTLESSIPKTILVKPENAEALWSQRKKSFFKPMAGYGSKGVYRGDKITKRVFAEILSADYIAQEFILAPEIKHQQIVLKYDIRNYAYNGKVFDVVARLYQGQVTNFRTEGGGFGMVVVV